MSRRPFYKLCVVQSVQYCHTVAKAFYSSATMAPKKRMSGGQVKVATKALKNIETNSRVSALGKIMTKTGVMSLIFQSTFYDSSMYTSEHDLIPTDVVLIFFVYLCNFCADTSSSFFFQRYNDQPQKAFFHIVSRTAEAIERKGNQVGMATNPG